MLVPRPSDSDDGRCVSTSDWPVARQLRHVLLLDVGQYAGPGPIRDGRGPLETTAAGEGPGPGRDRGWPRRTWLTDLHTRSKAL